MKNKTMGGLSAAVMLLLNSSQTEAHTISSWRAKAGKNPDSAKDNALLDMGQKLSNLSLSMLNKDESNSKSDGPSNTEMLQIHSDLYLDSFEQVFAKVYERNRGDDVDSNDIMAYSAMGADTGGDDEPAFGAGGAIMEALAQNDPEIMAETKREKENEKKKQTNKKSQKKKATKKPKKIIQSSTQSLASIIQDSMGGGVNFSDDSDAKPPVVEVQKTEQVEKVQKTGNDFMDGVLESTLTNKKNFGATRKLNSLEQAQADDDAAWASIALNEKKEAMKKAREEALAKEAEESQNQETDEQQQEKQTTDDSIDEIKQTPTPAPKPKPHPVLAKKPVIKVVKSIPKPVPKPSGLSQQEKLNKQEAMNKMKEIIKQTKIKAILKKKALAKAKSLIKAKPAQPLEAEAQGSEAMMPAFGLPSSISNHLIIGNGSQFRYQSQISDSFQNTQSSAPRNSLDEAAQLLSATKRSATKAGVNYELPAPPTAQEKQSIVQSVIAKAKLKAKTASSMYQDSAKLLANASTLGEGSSLDISPPSPQTLIEDKTRQAIEKTLSIAKAINPPPEEPVSIPKPSPAAELLAAAVKKAEMSTSTPAPVAVAEKPSLASASPALETPLPAMPAASQNSASSFLTTSASTSQSSSASVKESLADRIMKQIDQKLDANSSDKISGSAQKAAHTDLTSAIIESMNKAASKDAAPSEAKKDVSDGLDGQNKAIVDSLQKAASMVQQTEVKAHVPPAQESQTLSQQKVELSVQAPVKISMKHLDLNELNSLNKRKSPKDGKKATQTIHSLTHAAEPAEVDTQAKSEKEGNDKEHALQKQLKNDKKIGQKARRTEKKVIKLQKKSIEELSKKKDNSDAGKKEDKKDAKLEKKKEEEKIEEKKETKTEEPKKKSEVKTEVKAKEAPQPPTNLATKAVEEKKKVTVTKEVVKMKPIEKEKPKPEHKKVEAKPAVKQQSLVQKTEEKKETAKKEQPKPVVPAPKATPASPVTPSLPDKKVDSLGKKSEKIKAAEQKIADSKAKKEKAAQKASDPKKSAKASEPVKDKKVAEKKILEAKKKIAAKKASKDKPKALSMDEQIDQVYEDLHAGKIKDDSVAASLVPEAESEGFIGKHIKKMQEKERKKQQAEQEEKQAEEAQAQALNQGSFQSLETAYVDAKQSRRNTLKKKKGLLARAERKFLDDEDKAQEDLTLQAISDPQYRDELQAIAMTQNLNQKTKVKQQRLQQIQALSQSTHKSSGKMLDDEAASAVADALLG